MSYTILTDKKVNIKKPHRCICCNTKVHPPAVMKYQTAVFDGDMVSSYTCEICEAFMTPERWALYEYEMEPGNIWEDYEYKPFREKFLAPAS